MTNIRRILITAALIATLSLTALAPGASTAPSGYAFPSKFKREFVKECAKARGASRKECRCAVRKLERAYTWKQFKRVLRQVQRNGKFPRKAQRLIRSCAT